MTYSRAVPSQKPEFGVRPVSQPTDRAEREADRAADAAVRGQRVPEWSVAATPISHQVHRQEAGGDEKTEKEKYVEAAKKTGEAVLETEAGKKLKEKVLDDPTVKKIKAAATSPVGLGVGLTAVAGGVTALALTGKELPIQPPEIPLDKVTPGLSGKVTYSGPVNAPTFVGITITYKEQGPKTGEPKQTGTEKLRAKNAKLAAELAAFREGLRYPPGSKEAEEQRMIQEAIAKMVFRSPTHFGPPAVLVPIAEPAQPKKEQPVQRSPASTDTTMVNELNVDAALTEPGHPLDPETRQRMETRFGHDFSSVRIHDDTRSSAVAASLDAAAFTVDDQIVFRAGRFDPGSARGTHLLAHELAHVVQQRSTRDPHIHRRSVLESIGILLGIAEGTWEDTELRTYLKAVTEAGKIDGSYDADNKARAIVGRWKTDPRGWNLTVKQKVLLIKEMLDGPTLDADETAIIDLLEGSDPSHLQAILGGSERLPYSQIEADIGGANLRRLQDLVTARFVGGRNALLTGRVQTVGSAQANTQDVRVPSTVDPAASELSTELDRPLPGQPTQAQRRRHAALLEARRRLRVVTSAVEVGVGELFSTETATLTIELPPKTTARFSSTIPPALRRGLSNVAAKLIKDGILTSNSTIMLGLDLTRFGGSFDAYRFTRLNLGESGSEILVERQGGIGTEGLSPAQRTRLRQRFDQAGFIRGRGFGESEFDQVLIGVGEVPASHLSSVRGLRFERTDSDRDHPDAAGHYDQASHSVRVFDRAYRSSSTRLGGPGATVSYAAHAVIHEIGHALDLAPLRAAAQQTEAAQRALLAEFGTGDGGYSIPDRRSPERARYDVLQGRLGGAQRAESAARSLSGARWTSSDPAEVTDRLRQGARNPAFRRAALRDGGPAGRQLPTDYPNPESPWQEYFAESFALYQASPDLLRRIRPSVYRFIEQEFSP